MLFDPYTARSLSLRNRVVMAPMTRSRAVENNTANALMAEYYAQRASAGLIITEGVSPSPNGLGYARIPGLFTEAHVKGWRLVTQAVHDKGGKIVVQFCTPVASRISPTCRPARRSLAPAPPPCPGKCGRMHRACSHTARRTP